MYIACIAKTNGSLKDKLSKLADTCTVDKPKLCIIHPHAKDDSIFSAYESLTSFFETIPNGQRVIIYRYLPTSNVVDTDLRHCFKVGLGQKVLLRILFYPIFFLMHVFVFRRLLRYYDYDFIFISFFKSADLKLSYNSIFDLKDSLKVSLKPTYKKYHKEILNFSSFMKLLEIDYENSKLNKIFSFRLIKYCTVGLTGLFFFNGCIWLNLNVFSFQVPSAVKISIALSIIFNFSLNEIWTFNDKKGSRHEMKSIGKRFLFYLLISSGGILISYSLTLFLYAKTSQIYLSNFIAAIVTIFWNFFMNTMVTWRTSR